jgi:hypothetical protein
LYTQLERDALRPNFWGIYYGGDTQPPIPHGVLTRWTLGRTPTIGGVFSRVKMQTIEFPRVREAGSYLDEFACVLAEFDDHLRTVRYTKPEDRRDDALHATNYAQMLGARLFAALNR